MAYFTDPMSDEFRKAIEKSMKELEDDTKKAKGGKKRVATSEHSRKTKIRHLSKKTKEELR